MASALHLSSLLNSLPQIELRKRSSSLLSTRNVSFVVKAQLLPPPSATDTTGRRNVVQLGAIISWVSILFPVLPSFAVESKKGFLPVLDQKDRYEFLYPFGWQEIAIDGQDKVFKDVIEPLESVSVNVFPTTKQEIRELGPPQEVAEALIKKVLAPPTQKTKLIEAKEILLHGD
uniref:PsbP C-terminal domain-containing protein n=1 Tax=Kalanchoe fedtschenkoi TaxID=63787 RepID=A0A7N0TKY4_KALFE